MNTTEASATVRAVLHEVAPDADLDSLAPDAALRDSLELDSLDFLRVVEMLSQRSGHEIREDEYPKLATLASTVTFLTSV
jgi:acyl carrier protein